MRWLVRVPLRTFQTVLVDGAHSPAHAKRAAGLFLRQTPDPSGLYSGCEVEYDDDIGQDIESYAPTARWTVEKSE